MKATDILFETARLNLRKCTDGDVEALIPILGDPEVMRYSLKGALDRAGILDYIQNRIQASYSEHGYGLWAIILKESNQLIGLAGILHQVVDDTSHFEIGYRLAKKYWGRGLASEAANGIRDYAFSSLNIDRLISIIDPSNIRSTKVAERMGMTRIKSTTFHGFHVDIYEVCRFVEYKNLE